MTTRRSSLEFAVTLVCLLAAGGGCMTRKGYVLSGDVTLELNRVPWRTGPAGCYEVGGPDCLDCGSGCCHSGCGGHGCAPAARHRFHAVPTRHVYSQPDAPRVIGEEVKEEVVPGSERVIEDGVFEERGIEKKLPGPGGSQPTSRPAPPARLPEEGSTPRGARPVPQPQYPSYRRHTRSLHDQPSSSLRLRPSSWIFHRGRQG